MVHVGSKANLGVKPNFPGTTFECPLVVDLDGTLTPTDTLVESVIQLIKHSPISLLHLLIYLPTGRSAFKEGVASRSTISATTLPYRLELLAYLNTQRERGRSIILATAAHQSIANSVATHLGIFDMVLASNASRNLKGEAKLQAIRAEVGEIFVYAGDSNADIPIWQAAQAAVLVGVSPTLARSIRQRVPIENEFPKRRASLSTWLKALRVHQWLKNLLLFVPIFTAYSFTQWNALATAALAFLSFSLAASATYMVNDLWDIESDRAHPKKRHRAFASASIPILNGLVVAGLLLMAAVLIAFAISPTFLLMLVFYVVLTSLYSWSLKAYVLIDVIVLSVLYTLRILAGSVAIGVSTSSWLLAFSVFIFLSLALVKRCSELILLGGIGATITKGRDYRVSDLAVLWPLGVGAALSSVVVFGLFANAEETQLRYTTPELLWLVAFGLIYWLARLWIKTSRGEMHDDPLIYAIYDHGSRTTLMAMVIALLVARFFALEKFW